MPKLRVLSGKDVLRILTQFGFEIHSQRGSHVKLRRKGPLGTQQTLTIVSHDELDKGTLRAIFRQACRYIPEPDLLTHFYTL